MRGSTSVLGLAMELSDSESERSAESADGVELSASDAGSAGDAAGVHEDSQGMFASDSQGVSLSDEGESEAEMTENAMDDSGEARRICRQPLRPGLGELRKSLAQALPPIGRLSLWGGLEKYRMPQLLKLEPLGILLRQADGAASLRSRRNAELLPHGREPRLQVYGTLRCFSATHRVAKILTVRNKRELPEGLFLTRSSRKKFHKLGLAFCVLLRPLLGNGCLACLGGGLLCSPSSKHTWKPIEQVWPEHQVSLQVLPSRVLHRKPGDL